MQITEPTTTEKYLQNWKSHLFSPSGHDVVDGFATGLVQRPPQVFSECVAVLVLCEILVHAFAEVLPDTTTQLVRHPTLHTCYTARCDQEKKTAVTTQTTSEQQKIRGKIIGTVLCGTM